MKELVAVGLSSCAIMLALHTAPRTSSDWERRLDGRLRAVADSPAATPLRIVASTRTGTMDVVQWRLTRAGATSLVVVASDQLAMQVRPGLLKTVAEDADVPRLRLESPIGASSNSSSLATPSGLVGTQALLPHPRPIN